MKRCSERLAMVVSGCLALLCLGLVGRTFYLMLWPAFSLPAFVERGVLVSLTAAVVLLAHRLLLYRLPPRYLLCLWLVVLLQIAGVQLPQIGGMDYGLGNQLPAVTVEAPIATPAPTRAPAAMGQGAIPQTVPPAQDVTLSYQDGQTQTLSYAAKLAQAVRLIWCGGAVLLLGWFIGNYLYFVHRITQQQVQDNGQSSETTARLKLLVHRAQKALGMARKVPVCLTVADGPLLLGVARPRIVLPVTACRMAANASAQAKLDHSLYLIVLHELVHVKHRDNLWSFLAVLALITQWYNPLIWLCFFALKRDIERRCDAKVAAVSGDKKGYASVLLQTIQEKGGS